MLDRKELSKKNTNHKEIERERKMIVLEHPRRKRARIHALHQNERKYRWNIHMLRCYFNTDRRKEKEKICTPYHHKNIHLILDNRTWSLLEIT